MIKKTSCFVIMITCFLFTLALAAVTTDISGYIISAKNSEIKISKRGRVVFKDRYRGTAASVEKSMHNTILFIAVMEQESVSSLYTVIFDMKKNSVITRLANLPNPNVISLSPDNRYMVIDSGTAASIRQITIVDLRKGKTVHNTLYAADLKPNWISQNKLKYYIPAGRKVRGKPTLENIYDGTPNCYIQEIIWNKRKIIKTHHYKKTYME